MPSNRHGMHRKYALSLPGEKKKTEKAQGSLACLKHAIDHGFMDGYVCRHGGRSKLNSN